MSQTREEKDAAELQELKREEERQEEGKLLRGHTVQLKSGGPFMTVQKANRRTASCQWFRRQTLQTAVFPIDSLKRITQ